MNLYGLFILGVNIKYIVISILYRHINVPMAFKELIISCLQKEKHFYYLPPLSWYRSDATDVLELNPPGKTALKVLALAEMSQNSYLLGIISVALCRVSTGQLSKDLKSLYFPFMVGTTWSETEMITVLCLQIEVVFRCS